MSLREALERCFMDNPSWVFGVQDLLKTVRAYYEVTPFQEQPDLLHGQSRIAHEVRSHLAKFKQQGFVTYIARDQYMLNRKHPRNR